MVLYFQRRVPCRWRVGGLSGHEPHISDLRTPLFAKLNSEPHISGSEPHIAAPNPTLVDVEHDLPWYSRYGLYNHFYTENTPTGGVRFMPRYTASGQQIQGVSY